MNIPMNAEYWVFTLKVGGRMNQNNFLQIFRSNVLEKNLGKCSVSQDIDILTQTEMKALFVAMKLPSQIPYG